VHQDDNGGGSDETKQVVEWECQAYITDTLSLKQIDILRFWEVGNIVNIHSASGTDRLL
jgi:hypothetical protein